MAAIPLRCNICPQEPEFSDLSHLLTHVSSKGHLSHYLKAQLRGRHEEDVRQKLDAYDYWYDRYQIEQLLSQRLSAKVSKKNIKYEPRPSAKPTKRARARKSHVKESSSPHAEQSPVKHEAVIDPRLSQSQEPPKFIGGLPFHPSELNSADKPQTYVPRMSDWQINPYVGSHRTGYDRRDTGPEQYPADSPSDNIAENDRFKNFIRGLTATAYPEPPELNPSAPIIQQVHGDKQPGRLQAFPSRALFQDDDKDDLDDPESAHSPVLKGVKWPGMSLFDSATADAQRLRNQKKDRSILEQMAHNSILVEQMEDIYWPNGALKKRRFITGNVDSSPASQSSPVMRRPRRPRISKRRPVLAGLSTNGPTIPKRRGRKPKTAEPCLRAMDNETWPEAQLGHPRTHLANYDPYADLITTGASHSLEDSPSIRPLRRAFQVFNETTDCDFGANDRTFHKNNSPFGPASLPRGTCIKPRLTLGQGTPTSPDWYAELRSHVKTPVRSENSENLPPDQKCHMQGNNKVKYSAEKITQRYFSITGHEEPQFFDTMPPQMEFGGMTGPKYRGATLNPLNPYSRQLVP